MSPERSQSLISVTSQHQERKRDASAHVSYGSRMHGRRSSLSQRIPSGSSVETTSQGEVESLVQENEALRRRIRELELELSVQKSQTLSLED